MRYEIRALFCILVLFVVIHSSPQLGAQSTSLGKPAEIQISIPKSEYLLGEPVRLDLRLTTKGDFRAIVEDDSIESGAFRVFISRGGGEFLRYKFNGWVANRKHYARGSDLYSFDTILFNSKPETAHLSEYGRRQAEDGIILTDYAFPKSGDYRIKATLALTRVSDKEATWETVESNEISIKLKEPQGDDLKVWQTLKSDTRIGYFMTSGEAPVRSPSIQESVLLEVDKIISEYPDSYLAGILTEKLVDLSRRREILEREIQNAAQQSEKKTPQ